MCALVAHRVLSVWLKCVLVFIDLCVLRRHVLVVSRSHVVVCFDYTSYLKTLLLIYNTEFIPQVSEFSLKLNKFRLKLQS